MGSIRELTALFIHIYTYLFIIYTTISLLFAEKLISELNFKATKQAELYTKLENWPKTSGAYRQLLNDKLVVARVIYIGTIS